MGRNEHYVVNLSGLLEDAVDTGELEIAISVFS
jgi:hypothetical protein